MFLDAAQLTPGGQTGLSEDTAYSAVKGVPSDPAHRQLALEAGISSLSKYIHAWRITKDQYAFDNSLKKDNYNSFVKVR